MRPILFSIGNFHLFSFGLMVAIGLMLSVFLMERRAARFGFPAQDMVLDFIFVAVAFGFLGARVDYVFQNADYYSKHLLEIFAFWEGGLIFYGGVVGAFFALICFCRVKKVSFVKTLDFLLPFVALCHAFGRVGCFLNGCCGGKVCSLPWAVRFPETAAAVHPTQLYEVFFDLLLFAVLSYFYTRNQKRAVPESPGETALFYFSGYGMIRFVMEFFRSGNPYWGPLTINQWFSILIIFIPAILYICRIKQMRGVSNDRS